MRNRRRRLSSMAQGDTPALGTPAAPAFPTPSQAVPSAPAAAPGGLGGLLARLVGAQPTLAPAAGVLGIPGQPPQGAPASPMGALSAYQPEAPPPLEMPAIRPIAIRQPATAAAGPPASEVWPRILLRGTMTLYKWDKTTPPNNATADSTINWAEGQARPQREQFRPRDDDGGRQVSRRHRGTDHDRRHVDGLHGHQQSGLRHVGAHERRHDWVRAAHELRRDGHAQCRRPRRQAVAFCARGRTSRRRVDCGHALCSDLQQFQRRLVFARGHRRTCRSRYQ